MPSEVDTHSVLQRKLAAAQDEGRSIRRSILRAMRLGLARAAVETIDMAMTVIGATQARRSQDDLESVLPDDRLFVFLSGPGGVLGGICVDRVCVTTIIQQQTMGTVFSAPVGNRAFTDTDAAMVAPLVDAFLPRARDLVEATVDRVCLDGFQFAGRAEDRRSFILALEYESFRLFDLTVEIGGGVSQGNLTVILPDQPEPQDASDTAGDAIDAVGMEQSFGVMRAELMAVISRVQLPLSAFAEMRPGDVLPLIGDKLDKTEVLTIEGQKVALARLGQCRGMRALRLNENVPKLEAPSPDSGFSEHRVTEGTALTFVDPDIIEHAPSVEIAAETVETVKADVVENSNSKSASEQTLPQLSPEQAAAEISELAGLPSLEKNLTP